MLSKAIHQLIDDSGFIPSDNIFALVAPPDAQAPYAIFQLIDNTPIRDISGPSGLSQATYQVDCYAASYYEAKTASDGIREDIDGYRGTVTYTGGSVNIGGVSFQNEVDILDQTEEPILRRVSTVYLVTYEQ